MCTNDGKCEIRSSASPLRPICGSVQLCQPSVRIRGGTLSPGQNSWADTAADMVSPRSRAAAASARSHVCGRASHRGNRTHDGHPRKR
jgi:hypothetical protein